MTETPKRKKVLRKIAPPPAPEPEPDEPELELDEPTSPKPRKVTVRKKPAKSQTPESPKSPQRKGKQTSTISAQKLHELLETSLKPLYRINVDPPHWVMPNRARFVTWIDKEFKHNHNKQIPCGQSSCLTRKEAINLFPHQQFIKDYMQFNSPYRGLMLYHGIGVGKSCTSIAAAEMLLNHMDVVVMVPASLRDNYIGEIKKCGLVFYVTNQYWQFVPKDVVDGSIIKKMKLTNAFVTEHKGIWVPVVDKPANFDTLSQAEKDIIIAQVNTMIHNSFEFINYNGLKKTNIQKMVEGNVNPFDNKCVIVDEIHNLISVISNGGVIGSAIYKLLMHAKGMKIILLSGTPIINYPHEIAYLLNLITGPRHIWELKANKESAFDVASIKQLLESHKYIDSYEIDINARKIIISFLPEGFAHEENGTTFVKRETYTRPEEGKYAFADNDQRVQHIITELKSLGMSISKRVGSKDVLTLPEKEEDFNEYFVDEANVDVKNKIMFMRRILGTVSFYSMYSKELYPDVNITEVPLEMTDTQFDLYDKARTDERKKESRSKNQGKKGDGLFNSSGQVYRFYSRALCNFAFPEGIERPFPSKISSMKGEVDDFEESLDDAEVAKAGEASKGDLLRAYQNLVNAALAKLEQGDFMLENQISQYSPKFKSIYDKIKSINGSVMIYSQFRKVEGLGLFGMYLKKNGYVEFKIKKVGSDWEVDIDPSDYGKPKYIAFTGSNEEARILLQIFNSDFSTLPEKIKEKLPLLGGNNHRGDIIKVLMITKSGSEGISLKNVRQVHVMEPYWNHIRIDQVVGRAVRTNSHMDLPKEERNVSVFVYYMKLSKKHMDTAYSIRTQDKGVSSDEYIYDLAKRKAKIIDGFLDLMKRASVDCALNAKKHGSLKCFSFPVNINLDQIVFKAHIATDTQDAQYLNEVETNEWKGDVFVTKKGKLLVRRETNEVYDYDLYKHSGRLVKLGQLRRKSKKGS